MNISLALYVLVGVALLADSVYFWTNRAVVTSRVNAKYPRIPCRLIAVVELALGVVLSGIWLL